MSELLDKEQAARFLGVSVNTLSQYVSRQGLATEKVKGTNFFSKDTLAAFQQEKARKKHERSTLPSYTSKKFGADEYQVVQEWQLHKHDTASVDVEIGLLSLRIEKMLDDLKRYQGDKMMQKLIRLKLIQAIGQRRKCLSFLQQTDTVRYNHIIAKLKL